MSHVFARAYCDRQYRRRAKEEMQTENCPYIHMGTVLRGLVFINDGNRRVDIYRNSIRSFSARPFFCGSINR